MSAEDIEGFVALMEQSQHGVAPTNPPRRDGRYVLHFLSENGDLEIWNLDGVDWYDAPIPPHLHRCWAQTMGRNNYVPLERCACGATSFDGSRWMERNSRRRR